MKRAAVRPPVRQRAASCDDPVKMGFVQALGVLIDTVVICSCTAFMMLLAPANVTTGLTGMDLLQAAAQYHLGSFGVVFIAVTLALFSFSTFIGILFYAAPMWRTSLATAGAGRQPIRCWPLSC